MNSLNHIYRTIWSEALGAWIAVSEITKTKGKRSCSSLLRALHIGGVSDEVDDIHSHRFKPIVVALACCFAFNAQANPTGGNVVSGNASFSNSGNTLTVINTPGTIINWQGFSIGANEVTQFVQQNASSTVLNRVVTNNPSVILGTLRSNGQVYLVNANGIMFGAGSTVDVAGLVATSLNLSNADFLAGRQRFTDAAGAKNVSNSGNINAQQGGQIYLIAPNVANNGIITAPNGEILLAAGHSVELVNSNDPNLRVKITSQPGNVTNLGQLIAESGSLGLFGAVVKNSGTISADSATMQGGKIVLKATKRVDAGGTISASGTGGGDVNVLADMNTGTVNVSGTLDASATGSGNGGFIETSAAHVHVSDSAHVTTLAANGNNGTWLIDPVDFTIAATGGDMTGAAVAAALAGGNFSILSSAGATGVNGDIIVNDTVAWSVNQLTLNAFRNILINANLNASGTGSLSLLYGQGSVALGNTSVYNLAPGVQVNLPTGFNFSTQLGSGGTPVSYYVINSLGTMGSTTGTDLQGMTLTGNYVLGSNIDASLTSLDTGWNAAGGFAPIGSSFSVYFSGRFDGLGHTISNLFINRPLTDFVGLFGAAMYSSATVPYVVNNVGLVNANITGRNYVGGLVGYTYYSGIYGAVANSYVSGSTITGAASVGGLVGVSSFGNIINSYVNGGTVAGTGNVGGLVGNNFYSNISKSHVLTAVTGGASNVGGLAGATIGTISDSYVSDGTTITVNAGAMYVGGLAGAFGFGAITNSHYNIDGVLINGGNYVTRGGIYNSQYANWVAGGYVGLNIANYASLTSIGVNSYSINSVQGMQDMLGFADNAAYTFTLAGTVDLSTVSGFYIPYLAADFNGAGFTVSNLNITQPFANSELGLFGHVAVGSTVSNVALLNAIVNGNSWVGALAGWNEGTIVNSNLTGTSSISGSGWTGGLVGENNGSISNSYVSNANVSGGSNVGGLVGYNNGIGSSISNSYASGGMVVGTSRVGGLAGQNRGTIDSSHVSAGVVSGGTGGISVGGLVGEDWNGTISNSYVDTGTVVSGGSNVGGLLGIDGGEGNGILLNNTVTNTSVIGNSSVGGLVGQFSSGFGSAGYVDNNHVVNSLVTGTTYVGGLIGWSAVAVSNSSASGTTVSGTSEVGGLVGRNDVVGAGSTSGTPTFWGGRISNSYVSGGTVSGGGSVGGFAGNNSGDLSNSFVIGTNVTGTGTNANNIGGLAGNNNGTIVNTFASGGTVSGVNNVGGLVGSNDMSGTIAFSYADVAAVTGSSNVGGVVGNNYTPGSITNTFWNSGLAGGNLTFGIGYDFTTFGGLNTGALGQTTTQLMTMSTYAGWNIANTAGAGMTWRIYEGYTGPMLTSFLTALTVTANDATVTSDGTAYSGGNGVTYSIGGAVLSGVPIYGGTSQGAINQGSYVITASGLYSGPLGYDISYVNGALTITAAVVPPVPVVAPPITDPILSRLVDSTQGDDFFGTDEKKRQLMLAAADQQGDLPVVDLPKMVCK
jgi:filamentous hemagglutinin family protein